MRSPAAISRSPRFIDDADEVERVQKIDEKQLERVRADLSEYGQVGVG